MYEQNPATTKLICKHIQNCCNKTYYMWSHTKPYRNLCCNKTLHKCTNKTLPYKTSCKQLVHQKSALVRHKSVVVRQKRNGVWDKKFIKKNLDHVK
jgi:hypothetical protein